MKTLLTTIVAICVFTLNSSAQWTLAGGNIFPTVISNNLSLNTTTPESGFKLDVNGNSTLGTQGSARIYLGTLDATHAFIQSRNTTVAQNLTFFASAYNFTSGNVGIGTTAPSAPLEINAPSVANDASKALFLLNPSNTLGAGAAIIFGGPSVAYSTGYVRGYLTNAGTGGTGKLVLGSKTTGTSNDELTLYNGNVGIGTLSPDQKLTVNGQAHSISVVVTSTVPADYVFNNDYYLRPLTEVKAYINKNHHLPEVPSAAEFKKDGQNLGEMNMTLLKKVEELTLYILEKDKQAQQQQHEIDQLNKQVKQLLKPKK